MSALLSAALLTSLSLATPTHAHETSGLQLVFLDVSGTNRSTALVVEHGMQTTVLGAIEDDHWDIVYRAQFLVLPGAARPLVAAWTMTTKGNGHLVVYSTEDGTLTEQLRTFGVDQHDDGALLEGGRVDVQVQGTAAAPMLVVTGTISNEDGRRACRSVFARAVDGMFVEDLRQPARCQAPMR